MSGILDWTEFHAKFLGCTKLSSFTGEFASDDELFVIHEGALITIVNNGPSELTIPSYVNRIGRNALQANTHLTKVTIMENVTDIGLQAFRDCPVEAYYFSSTTPPVLSGDFWTFWFAQSGGYIYVPYSAVDTYKTASDNWDYIKNKIVGY